MAEGASIALVGGLGAALAAVVLVGTAAFAIATARARARLRQTLDRQRLRDWAFWWLACIGALASHPYGAFVLGAGIAAALATGWRQRRTWHRTESPRSRLIFAIA